MLRPIPSKILRSNATVKVCNGTDAYQNQSYSTFSVSHVHLQPSRNIVKTKDNTDIQLSSVLFVDARISSPRIAWEQLLETAHDNGGDMRVVVNDKMYTVISVDVLMDDTDHLHHWEVGLA